MLGFTFDYQLDRHCSKTNREAVVLVPLFDYQLDRHCSKTSLGSQPRLERLITS